MSSNPWLLLLYGLPARQTAGRVSLWRKLKKFGALQLKTSAYLLPDSPLHFERFQWLAKQVRDDGGEASLIRMTEIEGLGQEEIEHRFNDERSREFSHLIRSLNRFIKNNHKRHSKNFDAELDKFSRAFKEIREIDHFDCPAAHDAEMLLNRAAALFKAKPRITRLSTRDFAAKKWLTRPRPEIDRVGSAWLIRNFIDPKAEFIFGAKPKEHPEAVPYDMLDVEFTHQGDDCTFETFCKRFAIEDHAVIQLAEMIHDADLEDGKFKREEAFGLDRVFKGWARLGLSDREILAKGFECFDGLYASLRRA